MAPNIKLTRLAGGTFLIVPLQHRGDAADRAIKSMQHPVHSLDLPESLRKKITTKGFKISKKVAAAALEGIA